MFKTCGTVMSMVATDTALRTFSRPLTAPEPSGLSAGEEPWRGTVIVSLLARR
jgi:hypothetical protein